MTVPKRVQSHLRRPHYTDMATTLKLNIPSIAPRNSGIFAKALKVCLAVALYDVPVQYSKGSQYTVLLTDYR